MGFLCFGRKKKQNIYLRDSVAQTYKGPQKTYKGAQGSNYQPTLNRRKSFYLLGCIDCAGLCADISNGGGGGDWGGAGCGGWGGLKTNFIFVLYTW
jgi:hypothetical protein